MGVTLDTGRPSWRHQRAWQRAIGACSIAAIIASVTLAAPSSVFGARDYNYDAKGFDACAAPSTTTMQTWWTYSPYWFVNAYIGGSLRGCPQPNLTSTWVTNVRYQGWGIVPTWVGPQAPCTAYNDRFSTNLATARQQGIAQADQAFSAASSLGLGTVYQVIAYDLEPFGANCSEAVQWFIGGWVWGLHNHYSSIRAGVYGSSCYANIDLAVWGATNRPDWIWGGDADGDPNAQSLNCVSSSHWTGYTRHKQWWVDSTETYGGKTIMVDRDCAYGPVWANQSRLIGSC